MQLVSADCHLENLTKVNLSSMAIVAWISDYVQNSEVYLDIHAAR